MTRKELDAELRKRRIRKPLHVGAAALGTTAASLCRWLQGIHDIPKWIPIALRGIEPMTNDETTRADSEQIRAARAAAATGRLREFAAKRGTARRKRRRKVKA